MSMKNEDRDWEDFKLRHEAAVGYAQATLKTLTLVNGGAIISLLTFIGNESVRPEKEAIFWSFVWFSAGLTLSTLAHGLAYLVQESYLSSASNRMVGGEQRASDGRGNGLILGAALCCLASLALFFAGALVALDAIT